MNLHDKSLLRVDEVAVFFGVTRKTVYEWIDSGKLKAVKVGGGLRVVSEEAGKMIVPARDADG